MLLVFPHRFLISLCHCYTNRTDIVQVLRFLDALILCPTPDLLCQLKQEMDADRIKLGSCCANLGSDQNFLLLLPAYLLECLNFFAELASFCTGGGGVRRNWQD